MENAIKSQLYQDFEKHYQDLMHSIPADVNIDMPTLCYIKHAMFSLYNDGIAYAVNQIDNIMDESEFAELIDHPII